MVARITVEQLLLPPARRPWKLKGHWLNLLLYLYSSAAPKQRVYPSASMEDVLDLTSPEKREASASPGLAAGTHFHLDAIVYSRNNQRDYWDTPIC